MVLSKHLLKTPHQYALFGTFTTDHLENQFGKLRHGCGGTYFITDYSENKILFTI